VKPSTIRGRPSTGAAPGDPLEEAAVLVAQLERRVTRAHATGRVRQSQQVAVSHPVALAVLDRLVGERLRRTPGVPAADRATQRAAPAAEALDERREPEEVRRGAAHPRQRVERRAPRRLVAETGGHREHEDRGIVLRRPARLADRDDLGHRTRSVRGEAALDRLGVLAGELPLAAVVATALRAEDQEAAQPRPVVDRPGEAAGAVASLARERRGLRRLALTLQIGHRDTSSRGWMGTTVVDFETDV